MPYVARENNVVVGVFEVLQPGVAEEFLSADHADVVTFRSRAAPKMIEWGTVIRRLTPEEAATFDAAVNAAEPRFKWLILRTAYISSDDPDYPTLEGAFVSAYGAQRAAELLAS